jgi:hypothetical protein
VRDSRERVLDILEAIERIEKYGRGGKEEFERNELVQIWILHHLQPDMAGHLPEDVKEGPEEATVLVPETPEQAKHTLADFLARLSEHSRTTGFASS